ncbi:MAG TPA: fibronectin type III domain-containing protein, partial [Verrucomicrobiae bacterium]|nr:fibronectin type III domain-containing protein [Verrucomicrobiae bacterium]
MRNTIGLGKAALVGVVALLLAPIPHVFAETTPHDHSVELTAAISENPPEIALQWQRGANTTRYVVSRKVLGESKWQEIGGLDGSATSWTDRSPSPGLAYEYQVIRNTDLGYTGYGYICSGIRRAAVEDRGKMILLVEQSLAAQLPSELARLQQDLVGDGWTVIRRDVAKTAKPPEVKEIIRSIYNSDPTGTKSLFLFGNIAVAYSGKISPDMHENDLGAWPADVYYADLQGEWTDTTVNHEQAYNTGRSNFPGDGQFDQDEPPGEIRLQMGRVDLSNLTCFANKTPARYEVDLARQYLAKDHKFRHGFFDVQRRGMIFDRMYRGLEPEPQTCAAWRSFPSFFGRDNIRVLGQWEYFPTLANESYMWSYVVSGGSFYGSDYIGTSDDWALNNPKVVFTSFLGSWFGQWDRESDFLRAPLGSGGYTLASIYSGQPQWILHPMALGEPIGYCATLTQNNKTNNVGLYPPQINAGFGQVHIALMGDPSLRMHIVKPP